MRRWLVACLALLAAAGAIYLLLSSREPETEGEPNHGYIDAESRAKLRQVLREERGE